MSKPHKHFAGPIATTKYPNRAKKAQNTMKSKSQKMK